MRRPAEMALAPAELPSLAVPMPLATAPLHDVRLARPQRPPDEGTARELAQARAGDPFAQFAVAVRYATGRGVRRDAELAAGWFREAAINGIAAAQYDLAVLYERGRGLPQDPVEALIWYESAADQNFTAAAYRLGAAAEAGSLAPKNLADAARWYRRAAEQGSGAAALALAGLYERGEGVAASPLLAYGWDEVAAAAGIPEAEAARSRIAETLSHEQLAEARGRATLLLARLTPALPGAADPVPRAGGLILALAPNRGAPPPPRGMIVEIQQLLEAAHYDPGPADGRLGDLTLKAIQRYQQDAGLPVDGVPNAALLGRLRAAAAAAPLPAGSP